MKNSAKFWRITTIGAVIMVMFGLVLAGCATVKTISEETETSRAIFEAASDLVLSQPGGITASKLVEGLAGKFPGLKLMPMGLSFSRDKIQVNYGGTEKWPTTYLIRCTMVGVEGTAIENAIVTTISSVMENRVIEE